MRRRRPRFAARSSASAKAVTVTPATDAMPEHVDAKPDKPEFDCGTVLFWSPRYGWARVDRGGFDVYIGPAELARAGIERLEAGARICFEVRKATHGRKPWAARIRVLEPTA
jgi:cold shock CspA family protein